MCRWKTLSGRRNHYRSNFELHSNIQDPETAYSQKELRNILTQAIAELRPLHREVFLLRAVENLSVVETAKALQVSVSTVKTRMRRARRELKDILHNASKPALRPSEEEITFAMERRFEQTWLT